MNAPTMKELAAKAANGILELQVRDFSPHFEGEWRGEGNETLLQMMDAEDGCVDAHIELDGRTGKLVSPSGCGCCGGDAGYEFAFVEPNKANWNLAQL